MRNIGELPFRRTAITMGLSLALASGAAWAATDAGMQDSSANAATTTSATQSTNASASAMQSAQHPTGDRQQLREERATELIGAVVHNDQGKSLGEVADLVVDMDTGEVRYAVLAFDPGILSDEKLYGVPTSELRMSATGEEVLYELDRERLQRAALDRSSFDDDTVFDGKGVMNNLDTAYGLHQPSSGAQAHRVSDLIGKDVVSRSGDGLGEIADLVVDMNHQQVHYAVLEFDPSIASPEQNFAVPLHALNLDLDGDELVLAVDDSKLQAMKSFTDDRYARLNDPVWVADIDRYFVAVFPNAVSGGNASASGEGTSTSSGSQASSSGSNHRGPIAPTVRHRGDVAYVSGGIGSASQARTKALGRDMNLQMVFAQRDGSYLADVDVAVADERGNELLDVDSSGPLLYAQLPPGQYEVTATLSPGRTIQRSVEVPEQGRHTERFLFFR